VDEDAEKEALARSMHHINDTQWTKFCSTHLKRFEKKWTTKLEDYKNGKIINDSDSENNSDGEKEWSDISDKKITRPTSGKPRYQENNNDDDQEDEEDEDEENFMQKMLEQGMKNRNDKVKREKIHEKPTREEIENAKEEENKKHENEFFANNYWLKPELI